MTEIASFGLSGNPTHNGHVAVTRALCQSNLVDGCIVTVCGARPEEKKRAFAAPVHRLGMAQLALRDVGTQRVWLDVDREEVFQPSFTRHVDLLERQWLERAPASILPVIGMDLLIARDHLGGRCELETWADAKQLMERWEFLVIRRAGIPRGSVIRFPPKARVLDGQIPEVSSTDIRDRVALGQPIDHLVPPAVADYIRDNGLYR